LRLAAVASKAGAAASRVTVAAATRRVTVAAAARRAATTGWAAAVGRIG